MQTLWKTVWRFLIKLKIELPYDPALPLLGIYPQKTIIWKDTCSSIFTAALFIIAKAWKQLKCPSTDEWAAKMWDRTFPGGPVAKTPSSQWRGQDSIPGRGTRSHMLQVSSQAATERSQMCNEDQRFQVLKQRPSITQK